MINNKFEKAFVRVGRFVRSNQNNFGEHVIRVFSDEIQVDFKTYYVVKSFPEGADSMHIFVDDGAIVIRCFFYYDEEKEDAK